MKALAFQLILLASLAAASLVRAQAPPQIPPSQFNQLMVPQPAVDTTAPITASATFDSPAIRVGDKTFYRVDVTFTESAIQWPKRLPVPAGTKMVEVARGELAQELPGSFHALTEFVYDVTATAPGQLTIPAFNIDVAGATVQVPAATLDTLPQGSAPPANEQPPRRLALQITETNVYLGQPFRVRIISPISPGNPIEAIRDVQFNGDGLMMDKAAGQQSVGPVNLNGQLVTAYICEYVVTPIAAGPLKFNAQGFTAGNQFGGLVIIHGQVTMPGGPTRFKLLVSDPVQINVRPLPADAELPGFTGALGRFFSDPPRLSTNRVHVGQPIELKTTFHGQGDLVRMAPPAVPRSRDWEIIAAPPPAITFTLIPLTDEVHETPAIPFCYFDPGLGKYVDLTIPSLPVTVIGEGLPAEIPGYDDDAKSIAPLKLSSLAMLPGVRVDSLVPPQMRATSIVFLMLPVGGFLALWRWDRRRRYLEAHPDLVSRAQARHALRREKQRLQHAIAANDIAAFVHHAARAMSIAVAPHFPADPRALVGSDVLAQLDDRTEPSAAAETVKHVFAAADAQFAGTKVELPDLAALRLGVDAVLQQLEAKL